MAIFPIVGGTISLSIPTVSSWLEDMVMELNQARRDPKAYTQIVSSYPDLDPQERKETLRYLQTVNPCNNDLVLNSGLTRISSDWVRIQGATTGTGHGDFFSRVRAIGTYQSIAENIAYGYQEPRDIVVQWIIDHGVPDKGHRHNIYECNFNQVGVAKGPHRSYRTMTSVTFGRGFVPYS